MREPDEFRDRFIGRDRDDGFRLTLHDIEQCRFHRRRIALERARSDKRQIALGHRTLHAFQPGKTECVVLIKDCNPRNTEVLGQVIDPRLGLLKIGGAHIDDVTIVGITQKFCAGERADERDLRRGGDRLTGLRCGRSHCADQSEDFIVADDLLSRIHGLFRLITVVERFKLERASGDAAVAIGLVERGKDALAHALP